MLTGRLRQLDLGVIPAPSGAGALVLHAEEAADCVVVFTAFDPADRTTTAALATFRDCSQSIFGYPNDEAYWGVPAAGYGFYEVLDSGWSQRLTEFNRLRFPDTMPDSESRHYFMGCHDASGQFLARDLSVEPVSGGFGAALNAALRRYGLHE
ncbi:hypothetical protein BWI15_36410 [Kribbella sp. ALI-6-A]|uniref:hypothetical protein n=1 Tax=Kribbella sp. ALI-6-A TaxID=1933817 RepID=UPI00097C509A|nr:hypothetical protein [Kribbella sp. ALI-6-A]ONI68479.1 hypothetical protein BWI15_36410 [Kribbella sp. ALI-6-A]